MTAIDSACLLLQVTRNTRSIPMLLLILPNCVLYTQKKMLKLPKILSLLLFSLILEIGLLFNGFFFCPVLQSSARKSSTAVVCMSLQRTALPDAEAVFCPVGWGRESFGLKIETAGVLKTGVFFEFASRSLAWTTQLWTVKA